VFVLGREREREINRRENTNFEFGESGGSHTIEHGRVSILRGEWLKEEKNRRLPDDF
jgi:hypothetical protein